MFKLLIIITLVGGLLWSKYTQREKTYRALQIVGMVVAGIMLGMSLIGKSLF